jgi:nicotinamidase-related amidase
MKNIALLSMDNTQWFQNQSLNELYVTNGERAAYWTVRVATLVKQAWWLLYHLFDNHPVGHVSFSENYIWKNRFDTITYEEVKNRTKEKNWLAPTATFSVAKLQEYLLKKEGQTEYLWPVHCVADTQWSTLTPPLNEIEFDRSIPKGNTPDGRDYSWFDTGELEQQLTKDAIDTVIITWVATDYCVGQTALDAVAKGYTTYVVSDAIEGVAPETSEAMKNTCTAQWIIFITTDELEQILVSSRIDK